MTPQYTFGVMQLGVYSMDGNGIDSHATKLVKFDFNNIDYLRNYLLHRYIKQLPLSHIASH